MTFADVWSIYLWPLIVMVAQSVLLLVILLVAIAYVLLADRKIWAAVQVRRGPNVVGPWGLLQSFADLLKFVLKEPVIPAGANKGVFLLAPLVSCVLALAAWAVIPVNFGWVIADINVGILYVFAISSLGVYGIIMAGWASNSKYPFLAALRSAAQMVSYEVSIGFVIITVLLCVGSLNLTAIVEAQNTPYGLLGWYWLPLLPMFVVFLVSALAETNRPPFDLVEAESELVAGFMVEYASTPYLLFMLGEYVAIATMCALGTILFFGGWLPPVRAVSAVHLGAGRDLVHAQGAVVLLPVCHGQGDRAALPLRSAHAARLEGVPAAVAGDGGGCRGGAAILGARAEMTKERFHGTLAGGPDRGLRRAGRRLGQLHGDRRHAGAAAAQARQVRVADRTRRLRGQAGADAPPHSWHRGGGVHHRRLCRGARDRQLTRTVGPTSGEGRAA
jgi:NADH-quinone oxidoreductase subunit H